MPVWALPLVGVVATFFLTYVRDGVKDARASRKKQIGARTLLALYATTSADDAIKFLDMAIKHVGSAEDAIAASFADITSTDHVYREQIANRLDDLSDELKMSFNETVQASNGAAHSIAILARWSSTFFGIHNVSRETFGTMTRIPTTLGGAVVDAGSAHLALLEAAQATLRKLRDDGHTLSPQANMLCDLTPPRIAPPQIAAAPISKPPAGS